MTDPRLQWKPFPTELLPEPLRTFVVEAARSISCNEVFIAMPCLAALSSLLGPVVELRLKETWLEQTALWLDSVGRSGSVKSPGFKLALEPLRKIQEELHEQHMEERKEYQSELLEHKRDLKMFMAGKIDDPPEKPTEPTLTRLYVGDITMEALGVVLRDSDGATLYARDEMGTHFLGLDRYGATGAASAFNEMFHGEPLVIDRKSAPEPIFVKRALISMTGTIQPDLAKRAFGTELFASGLVARHLMAWPVTKPKTFSEETMPVKVRNAYVRLVRKFWHLRRDTTLHEITLDADAKVMWRDFVNEWGVEVHGAPDDNTAASYSKLEAYSSRFALLFEHITWAVTKGVDDRGPQTVGVAALTAGIELVRWFGREQERIYRTFSDTILHDQTFSGAPPSNRELAEGFVVATLLDEDWFPSNKLFDLGLTFVDPATGDKAPISNKRIRVAKTNIGVESKQVRSDNGQLIEFWVCRLPAAYRKAGGHVGNVGIQGQVGQVDSEPENEDAQDAQETLDSQDAPAVSVTREKGSP